MSDKRSGDIHDGSFLLIEYPVTWGDHDDQGHVNNKVFFHWFEVARSNLWHHIFNVWHNEVNEPALPTKRTPVGVMSHIDKCVFVRAVKWPAVQTVVLAIRLIETTAFTMRMEFRAHAKATGVLVFRGESTGTCVEAGTGRKMAYPDEERARVEWYLQLKPKRHLLRQLEAKL